MAKATRGKSKPKRKPQPSKEEIAREKTKRKHHNRIRSWLKNMGFIYLSTRGKHLDIGQRRIEIDGVYIQDNVIVFCEETTTTGHDHQISHLLKSEETANTIEDNFEAMLEWLRYTFADQLAKQYAYSASRYKRRYLYLSTENLDIASKQRFEPLVIMPPSTLEYFTLTAKTIKRSARFEFYKYLGLERKDVGMPGSSEDSSTITATIICPEDNAGLPHGIRMVSFMMCPDDLLECGYVLRRDNWESQTAKYQRLLEHSRVNQIRRYIADEQQAFVNNIIVGLPRDVSFSGADSSLIPLESIQDVRSCSMHIPKKFNSICIIDGQHRVFAHYAGNDGLEEQIRSLASRLHLLVTGFVYPENLGDKARAEFESETFSLINSKAKPVNASVLLYIQAWKHRYSPQGIARQILVLLNGKNYVFYNMLQLSDLGNARIKTSSIIKFALYRLVSINEPDDAATLFHYWDSHGKTTLTSGDRSSAAAEEALDDYIDFAAKQLNDYFAALREAKTDDWKDGETKLLSTICVNGFILALRKSLPALGLQSREFYRDRFNKLDISFKKGGPQGDGFPYTSSQYGMFSDYIVAKCFPEAATPEQRTRTD